MDKTSLLAEFTDEDNTVYLLYQNGALYRERADRSGRSGQCEFVEQYFAPNFLQQHYLVTDSGVYRKLDTLLFSTNNRIAEPFERYASVTALFIASVRDTAKFWTDFTLQSPRAPSVSDYVRLRQCIMRGTCDFLDNRIDLAPDPQNTASANQTLRFRSVAPSQGMVTAKSSITSTNLFSQRRRPLVGSTVFSAFWSADAIQPCGCRKSVVFAIARTACGADQRCACRRKQVWLQTILSPTAERHPPIPYG
jgi:hypothetical protein